MLETIHMSDKELDEAIAIHLEKIDTLEAKTKCVARRIKSNSAELMCGNECNKLSEWNVNVSKSTTPQRKTLHSSMMMTSPAINYQATSENKICDVMQDESVKLYDEKMDNTNDDEEYDDDNSDLSILHRIRNHLADYQAMQGIPKDDYYFTALIKIMGQATGKSLLALFYIIVNVAPMAQILLFILRFILDKWINIRETADRQQIIIKTLVLFIQLTCVYLGLTLIFGLIWMPILYMIIRIISCCTIDPY